MKSNRADGLQSLQVVLWVVVVLETKKAKAMKILFRVDSSTQIGAGHLMRCLSLAASLRQYATCEFMSMELEGSLHSLISQQGYRLIKLAAGFDSIQQANWAVDSLSADYDWLIVDHYQLDYVFEHRMRQIASKILVIDDLTNRRHDCDLLLNQGATEDWRSAYQALTPPHCHYLLGVSYCLLRQEFYPNPEMDKGLSNRLLISLGGSDFGNHTQSVIEALLILKWSTPVDIVLGGQSPWNKELMAKYEGLGFLHWHIQCDYMAKLMRSARLSIGAGGSSHLERCISALPALVMTVADNQKAGTAALHQLQVCIDLGNASDLTEQMIAQELSYYWRQTDLLKGMAKNASKIVVENGCNKVVQQLLTIE